MRPDKEIKRWFKTEASKEPEKYYAVSVLKERGYTRKQCRSCGTFFWSTDPEREVCGDASCAGGFTLFENNPCRKKMDYLELWQAFERMFRKKGYAVLPRYPVVARWNPTMDFTIASIAAFQPYVVSGEVEPPAPELIIPQFCLRFGDVDNVGITMSHMTGFVMIGQHAFVEDWDQNRFFTDIFDWLTTGLGLPNDEIIFHEDAWAGGGNFGPCMEFFSRGVELGNQVYMLFEQDEEGGYRELSRKVLDMGMGHERNAWFSQGEGTIYDAAFPTVMKRLKERTGVTEDAELMQRYIPHAAYLNLDEVDDLGAAWERVAKAVGTPVEQLRAAIEPMTALYSIAEHARTLLFALTDGGLPSNVGGGYNLRIIFRRAQSFIEQYQWPLDLAEVAAWHAEYLAPLFPELSTHLDEVRKILAVELQKYRENKRRARQVIAQALRKPMTTETLITLYDTQGIQPEQVRAAAREHGITVTVPDNFYSLIAARQEERAREQRTQTRRAKRLPLDGMPKTRVLYYDSYDYTRFESPVVAVLDGNKVVLERTAFYPTSGGQEHDKGTLHGVPVTDVLKQDGVIVHVLAEPVDWQPGMIVEGVIDLERRRQLAQHHTATHIINGAARKILGDHVWQAGAAKTTEKGRIDITHYALLTDEELRRIEEEANRIVAANLPVKKTVMPKNLAEAAHGFRLYQGGAVPGKEIRVVEIPGFDTEACGGTHLNTTGEVGRITLLGSRKVQDGIIRIEFVAGKAADSAAKAHEQRVEELAKALGVDAAEIPSAAERLFTTWKKLRKAVKKQRPIDVDALLNAPLEPFTGDVIAEAARRLQTQPEHLLKTINRFSADIEALRAKL